MIFTPFTGKDNHGKCVTFGAGLLSNEDVDSYSWMLTKFTDCMEQHLKLLISDQDPALKIVVGKVLPNTRHRLCMWHIMLKVADKISVSLRNDAEFKNRLCSVVWSDYLEPLEFEEAWNVVIEEFGLIGNSWFDRMYDMRSFWIPAFFRDFPMGGLFRTTSLSESVNSVYHLYSNTGANLVEMYMHFESVIDTQRHAQDQSMIVDETCIPDFKTPLPIERNAAKVYTSNIFMDVQEEIDVAVNYCTLLSITDNCDVRTYEVDDNINGCFKVSYNASEDEISCACKQLFRKGLLCRHIFLVMKNMRMEVIPDKYIYKRWTKLARAEVICGGGSYNNDPLGVGVSNLFYEACKSIGMVNGDSTLMDDLIKDFKDIRLKYSKILEKTSTEVGKNQMFEQFYGSSIPDVVSVFPPITVSTKRSGSRLNSRKEAAIKRANKPKLRCRKCNQLTNHDSRNCDKILA